MAKGPLAAALFGAAFFVWVHGPSVIDPSNVDWLMRSDWRFQFLGWQFFRQEPWSWPPGLINGYNRAPHGSAIGLTDSIPLVAFALKPLSAALPMPFQYLGAWLMICFALQGYFGALLVRVRSASAMHQVAGGALFVLLPTLLNRTVHSALCAQWLILWAIWVYVRHRPHHDAPFDHLVGIGVIAGLVHPYLAVMVLALEGALVVRVWLEAGWRGAARAADGAALALVGVGAGWWASGLFSLPADALAREGLTTFSMNLLGPVSPNQWSALLPEQRIGAGGQGFEGFQYMGAGALALIVVGLAVAALRTPSGSWRTMMPLLAVSLVLAAYALSPRVTSADRILLDYSTAWLERASVFRVTGRFFWPAAYTMLTLALGAVVSRLRPPMASVVLCAAVALQAIDLWPGFSSRRAIAHSPAAHRWSYPFTSPEWGAILSHYRHLALVLPPQCGTAPVTFEAAGYLASLHGLSVNTGEQSRWDDLAISDYCDEFRQRLTDGRFDDDTLYLLNRGYLGDVQKGEGLACGELDGVTWCATARSRAAWRARVPGPLHP